MNSKDFIKAIDSVMRELGNARAAAERSLTSDQEFFVYVTGGGKAEIASAAQHKFMTCPPPVVARITVTTVDGQFENIEVVEL